MHTGASRPNPLSHDDFPALPSSTGASKPPPSALPVVDNRFGLGGFVSFLKQPRDSEMNIVQHGYNISSPSFGLYMPEKQMWHRTFACPASQVPVRANPSAVLPGGYALKKHIDGRNFIHRFTIGTLFYLFYTMPEDALQLSAAAELHRRGWRFHKGLTRWVCVEGGNHANPLPPGTYKVGVWDYNMWDVVRQRLWRGICGPLV